MRGHAKAVLATLSQAETRPVFTFMYDGRTFEAQVLPTNRAVKQYGHTQRSLLDVQKMTIANKGEKDSGPVPAARGGVRRAVAVS
jgi:hypothetical protein